METTKRSCGARTGGPSATGTGAAGGVAPGLEDCEAFARAAAHWRSRPGAAGEFRKRALRADTQIGGSFGEFACANIAVSISRPELTFVAAGDGIFTLPKATGGLPTLPGVMLTGCAGAATSGSAPQTKPTASNQIPDLPLMPTATKSLGQICGP